MKLITALVLFSCSFAFAKESCLKEKSQNKSATYYSCELKNGDPSTQINLDSKAPYIVYNNNRLDCTQPMMPESKIIIMNCVNKKHEANDWSSFQTIVLDKDEGVLKTRFGSPRMSGLVFEEKCKPQALSETGSASTNSKSEKVETKR